MSKILLSRVESLERARRGIQETEFCPHQSARFCIAESADACQFGDPCPRCGKYPLTVCMVLPPALPEAETA